MGTIGTKYDKEVALAITEVKEGTKDSWTSIGKLFSIDRRTAKKWYERYREEAKILHLLSEDPLFSIDHFKPIEQTGDVIVTADWHVPLYDPKMVNHVLKVAHEHNIKTLVIGGDFWDMTSYSHYPPHQREAPFEVERSQGIYIMETLLDWFDEIFIFWGNHDWRFMRMNDFKFSFSYGMKMLLEPIGEEKLSKIQFSDLDHMHLNQGERKFRFTHQNNFSKIPLSVPRQLAQKYQCSVITAHSHHCAQGVALDGFNLIFEVGGLFDKHKTEYIQKTTTHHEWVPGFLMFKDTVPTLYSPVFGNI